MQLGIGGQDIKIIKHDIMDYNANTCRTLIPVLSLWLVGVDCIGDINLNTGLACDQVVHLEAIENSLAHPVVQNDF